MKLIVRVPLLIGAVVLITSVSIGLAALLISSATLEETILNAIASENKLNAGLLSAILNGQLDVLGELALRQRTRTMDWETVRPSLQADVSRIGVLDLALVYPDGTAHYVSDDSTLDLGDRDYVIRAMAGEKNIGVVFSRVTAMTVVMFAAPVFESGEKDSPVIGVLIARRDGGHALSDVVVSLTSSMDSGYSFLVDGEGTIIAHPNTELVTNQFNPITEAENNPSYKPLADVITTALRGKNGVSRYVFEGKTLLGHYSEVPGHPWILFSSIEKSDVDSRLEHMRFVVFAIGIVLIAAGLIIAFFIGRSIVKPVVSMAGILEHAGKGDLTRRVNLSSKDEIGDLSRNFDMTFEKISSLIKEAEVLKRVEIAEASNRAKSDFLARMSHEIRTPMNAIIGITEIELSREEIKSETKEGLLKIYNSGYTLLGIINDILDLSKIEAGKLELSPIKYDTPSLINDTVQLNITRIGSKPIEFKLNISENLPAYLVGDELHIKQIMNNLLSNAFKYTEKGTVTLEVTTEGVQNKGQNADAAMLVITVRDTGQGMTTEQVERLFDEYSRFNTEANRATEGTGLGMNITKNLIQMMDGTFNVESKPGVGTAFTVRLMQQTAGNAVIGKELAQRLENFRFSGESQIKKTQIVHEYMPYGSVLVVDDLDTNLFVAKGLMTPYGLKIETASSGFEALKKIQGGASYDIVFMDHMMPEMDGIETTKRCRESGYTRPIVALTANAIAGQAEIFLENGFDGFISKPIDLRELNAVLNKFVRDKQPPENIEKARQTAKHQTSASGPDPALRIPGVDVQQGIALTGGTETLYRQVLALFRTDAEERLPLLQTVPEPDALSMFVTQVHALKSASASLGAAKVSAEAAALEAAGKEGNLAFIQEHLSAFVQHLVELVKGIDAVLETDKTAPAGETAGEAVGDRAALIPLFRELAEALQSQNAAEVDRILDELNGKPMDTKTKETVEKISDYVLMTEFDKAAEILEGLLN